MCKLRTAQYFIALYLALRVVAYEWTPCSLGAWIESLQKCAQPCYGEAFYDTFYNSTLCGDYVSTINSTKKSDVKCLCLHQVASISQAKNITKCDESFCTDYNVTYYDLNQDAYIRMCSWSYGEGTCNATTTSMAAPLVPQALSFLTGLSIILGALAY